ncbi:MAG: heat-inducible transcription repressor HrcA [Nitrospinae bacterium]|nr:heat-inducible transcription repressor HrcA [Nitrospinota bacterium]
MPELNKRKQSVLNVVVRDYISTAEPVGSGTLCRKYFSDLSSATIRSVMSSLVCDGYLSKPHTSSGRIPTDKGYRFYVDSQNAFSLGPQEARFIEKSFSGATLEMEELPRIFLKVLSRLTNKAGIILCPKLDKTILKRVELIRISAENILVVIVGSLGDVFNKYVHMDEDLSQELLNSISRFLNDKYSGLTMPSIREKVFREMTDDRKRYDSLVKKAMEICSKFLDVNKSEDDLRFTGVESLFNQQEFREDASTMRKIFKTLESKAALIMILDKCLEGEDSSIFIGSEMENDEITECAVIAHSYKCGDRPIGAIGVIGHKRMEYPRIISIVNYMAAFLSRKLSETRL